MNPSLWPVALRESRLRLDAGRPFWSEAWRRGDRPARKTLPEMDALLRAHHPDYRPGALRALRAGASRGLRAPSAAADRLDGATPPLEAAAGELSCDVLVVGGGVAGLSAALAARAAGARVRIATRRRLGDGASQLETDGFPASEKLDDSPPAHLLDAAAEGKFRGDLSRLSALVLDAPASLAWLAGLGVLFSRHANGALASFADASSMRARLHRAGERTGREVARVLREAYLAESGEADEWVSATNLVSSANVCAGVQLKDEEGGGVDVRRARAVVWTAGSSADSWAIPYASGVPITACDARQWAPWAVAYPVALAGFLLPDDWPLRGAMPLSAKGEPFVDPAEPRDVVVAAAFAASADASSALPLPDGSTAVWLDLPSMEALSPGSVARELPALSRALARAGLDPGRDPLPVRPRIRHELGGLVCGVDGSTSFSGLYVAGRAAGGLFGEAVAPGMSLLRSVSLGRRAGASAAAFAALSSRG